MHRRIIQTLLPLLFSLNLTAPLNAKGKDITIGTTVGDFADMVNEGLKPQLEKKGYKVKLIQFNDYVQPNLALAEHRLDANIFQHKPYLEEFTKEKSLKLSPLAEVPTAPLGLYPGKKQKLADIAKASTIAVPNDPTNLARALRILADLSWIELKGGGKDIQISLNDIVKNPHNLKIVQLEAAQLPRARQDVDFVVINGNYAISSGIGLKSALFFEKSPLYLNWAVVRAEDLGSDFAKDIQAALNSEEFKAYSKKKFVGYRYPSTWN